MRNVTLLAIDLAKNFCQLHGTDSKGKPMLKKKINREKLLEFVATISKCSIYMEACASSNYWGRKFIELGHKVKLINPKYVKPFVKRNKNDEKDAEAIAVAAMSPNMSFCEVKTEEYQDMQSTHRIRSLLISQRTALTNQIRGLLTEYGIFVAKGDSNLRKKLAEILGNRGDFSILMSTNISNLYDELKYLEKQIKLYNTIIENWCMNNEGAQRLKKVPGIGVLGATLLVSMLKCGPKFKNGRHFAAFLGLTPKQHSSGGKECLLGISKGGDTYARTILVHGARAVLLWVDKKTDNRSVWLKKLATRVCGNKVAVALANKMARTVWAMVHYDKEYDPNHKPTINYRPKLKALKAA